MGTFKIPYEIKKRAEIQSNELVLTPFLELDLKHLSNLLLPIDRVLSTGTGIQIAARAYEPVMNEGDLAKYKDHFTTDLMATGFTAPRNFLSALIVSTQLLRHPTALEGLLKPAWSEQERRLVEGSGYDI